MDKDKLKEQLKKQSQPQEKGNMVKDPRFHGLERIYFFQRKKDEYIFPLDSELQASHLMRDKKFNDKFVFIGWSKGEHYAKFKNRQPVTVSYNDDAEVADSSKEKIATRKGEYDIMMELELEEAIENEDKTPPRDFRVRTLQGNIADNQISGWIGMMR